MLVLTSGRHILISLSLVLLVNKLAYGLAYCSHRAISLLLIATTKISIVFKSVFKFQLPPHSVSSQFLWGRLCTHYSQGMALPWAKSLSQGHKLLVFLVRLLMSKLHPVRELGQDQSGFGVLWLQHVGSVQSLSCVRLFATPWTSACQDSLSITNSQNLLKRMFMPSNHHPLLSPSSPAFNLSQHQGLFQWVGSSHQVAKVLELQRQSFQRTFRTDFL